jgi:hypothetical protein
MPWILEGSLSLDRAMTASVVALAVGLPYLFLVILGVQMLPPKWFTRDVGARPRLTRDKRASQAFRRALLLLLVFVPLDWAGYNGKFRPWDGPRSISEVLSHVPMFLFLGFVFFLIFFVLGSRSDD